MKQKIKYSGQILADRLTIFPSKNHKKIIDFKLGDQGINLRRGTLPIISKNLTCLSFGKAYITWCEKSKVLHNMVGIAFVEESCVTLVSFRSHDILVV